MKQKSNKVWLFQGIIFGIGAIFLFCTSFLLNKHLLNVLLSVNPQGDVIFQKNVLSILTILHLTYSGFVVLSTLCFSQLIANRLQNKEQKD